MPQEQGEIRAELDMRKIMAEIKGFDPALARAVRKKLRLLGDEIAQKMRTEVRKAPPTGGRTRGSHRSREQVAAGIGVAIKTGQKRQGVYVTGSSRKLPTDRRPFARSYNKKQWRHPVFPSRSKRVTRWVSQQGNPYFGRSVAKVEPQIEQEMRQALDEAIATVRGSR